jgi:thioredoxin-related protein
MKKIALLIYLPVLLLSGDLKDALLKARKEHKPVMVYVKSDSCTYCEKMKERTLHDATVQNNIKDFIVVTVDKSGQEAQQYLPATKYTPTTYFISSKFKVVNTVKGYLGKDDFNLWVNDSKTKLGMGIGSTEIAKVRTTKSESWFYDMASAEDYALQTGKHVMVYVENRRSSWSKKMRKSTLHDKKVKKALENFVWVKLQKNSAEAKAYGLNPALAPTVYFRRADGSSLATAKGYFGAKDFMLWVNYAKGQI